MIGILVISRCAAPPYSAAPDFHLKVKRLNYRNNYRNVMCLQTLYMGETLYHNSNRLL